LFYCLIFFLMPNREINKLILICLFIFLLPMLFEFQRKYKWDRKIGDLSYPIYISHMMVIYPVRFILEYFFSGYHYIKFIEAGTVIVCTVMISIVLDRYIGRQIESLRNRNRNLS